VSELCSSHFTYWRHLQTHSPSTKTFCVFEDSLHNTVKHRDFVALQIVYIDCSTVALPKVLITYPDTEKVLQNHLARHRKGATNLQSSFIGGRYGISCSDYCYKFDHKTKTTKWVSLKFFVE
jgi:hypothetical protein